MPKTTCARAIGLPTVSWNSWARTKATATLINKESRRVRRLSDISVCPIQIGLTFSALGPFGPRPSLYDTLCPSRSAS
jgi:hypothetical protein